MLLVIFRFFFYIYLIKYYTLYNTVFDIFNFQFYYFPKIHIQIGIIEIIYSKEKKKLLHRNKNITLLNNSKAFILLLLIAFYFVLFNGKYAVN